MEEQDIKDILNSKVAIWDYIVTYANNGVVIDDKYYIDAYILKILEECIPNWDTFNNTQKTNLKSIWEYIKDSITNITIKNYNMEARIPIDIPVEYVPVYNEILQQFSSYGVDKIKDCYVDCTSQAKRVINMFHMFYSAMAAYATSQIELCTLLINTIKGDLNLIKTS